MAKFKVGDMVECVRSGSGLSPECIGKRTKIIAIDGTYSPTILKTPGVKIERIPDCFHNYGRVGNDEGGWIAEYSFKLIESEEWD